MGARIVEDMFEKHARLEAEIASLQAQFETMSVNHEDLRQNFTRITQDNERLRAALKKCADKLERCIVHHGTDPEFAAEAVKEFRAFEQSARGAP